MTQKVLSNEDQIKILENLDYDYMVSHSDGVCLVIKKSMRDLGYSTYPRLHVCFPLLRRENAYQFGARTDSDYIFWWPPYIEYVEKRKAFVQWMIDELKEQLNYDSVNSSTTN